MRLVRRRLPSCGTHRLTLWTPWARAPKPFFRFFDFPALGLALAAMSLKNAPATRPQLGVKQDAAVLVTFHHGWARLTSLGLFGAEQLPADLS